MPEVLLCDFDGHPASDGMARVRRALNRHDGVVYAKTLCSKTPQSPSARRCGGAPQRISPRRCQHPSQTTPMNLTFPRCPLVHLRRDTYHDFEGITVHLEEGQRILASATGKPVLLLRNHGPVTIGFSLANAFSLMWLLNRACEVQVASQALGRLRSIPVPVLEACVRDAPNFNPKFGAGQDAFDAMQRLVDWADPSYRA